VRISVDNQTCEAHGQCNTIDPDLFTLDDEGYSNIGIGRDVPPDKEVAAEQGIDVSRSRRYVSSADRRPS
jgi:ferredoxin